MSRTSKPQPAQGVPISRPAQDGTGIEASISNLHSAFILNKTSPIADLEKAFYTLFTAERCISFRTDLPKGLNSMGCQLLESSPKLWLLCIAIRMTKNATMKSILPLIKAAVSTVQSKREVIEGLDEVLSIQDIKMTEEDAQALDRILSMEPVTNQNEVLAVSECGKYALIRLSQPLQKKMGSSFAVTPVKGNPWTQIENLQVKPLKQIFLDCNYTYHPGLSDNS